MSIIRCLTVLLWIPLLLCESAWALDPRIPMKDLNHVAWSERDGVPADAPALAQTMNGWLWLASLSGLYRFDGVKFERYPLPTNEIVSLHAVANGDLLISYAFGGAAIIHPDGKLQELGDPGSTTRKALVSLDMDAEGTVWALGWTGLHRYRGGHWETIASGPEWTVESLSVMVDQYDQVWASNDSHVFRFDRNTGLLVRLPGDDYRGTLTQSPDGRVWVVSYQDAHAVPMPPQRRPLPRRSEFNHLESRGPGQFDRDGNLWIARCPSGLCRIVGAGNSVSGMLVFTRDVNERIDQPWQLSSPAPTQVLEDRENNIWISTPTGIDRFRANKLIPAHMPPTLSVTSMAADKDGQLWATGGGDGTLWKIPIDAAPVRVERAHTRLVTRDRDGALLFVGKRDIERVDRGLSTRIPLPPIGGKSSDHYVLGVLDDGKVLWMVSLQNGLMGLVDGRWMPRSAFNLPPSITTVAPGSTGQLWLGNSDGKLRLYDNGKLSSFDIGLVGVESGIFPGPELVVGGERGIAVLQGGHFMLLGPPGVEALRNVTGMSTSTNGDRWLNGIKGVVRIRRMDWEAALREPANALRFETIGHLEGYPGRAPRDRLPSVLDVGKGRIWFRTSGDLMRLETSELQTNQAKPHVSLLALNTPDAKFPAATTLSLPADTRNFDIQYTAPGLRKPEEMRFQYRLDGLDQEWRDAGTRRAAYYTNVGAGRYTFRARAINEDGITSESAAVLPIEIAPTLTETVWFRIVCVILVVLSTILLYRTRVRAAMLRIARQLQTRMDERERIARTLHDTFLQSVHVVSMQLYAEVTRQAEGSPIRERLNAILDRANRTIDEGRAQVQQLRTGTDLEQLLAELGELLTYMHPDTTFSVEVEGKRRSLSALVQEELGDIGQEAIRNAFRHAGANRIKVRLMYGADKMVLRVIDDGSGFDTAADRSADPEGHWGLLGMRERARNMGARLSIISAPREGTVVELETPGELAYSR